MKLLIGTVIVITLAILIFVVLIKGDCHIDDYEGNMKVIIFITSGNHLSKYEEFQKKYGNLI